MNTATLYVLAQSADEQNPRAKRSRLFLPSWASSAISFSVGVYPREARCAARHADRRRGRF